MTARRPGAGATPGARAGAGEGAGASAGPHTGASSKAGPGTASGTGARPAPDTYGPGTTFAADVTGAAPGARGFDVFRREWEAQTGEALPLPSFDTGASGAFRIGVRAAKVHDAVVADVRFARFLGRPSGSHELGDRVLVHLMTHGSWRFVGLGGDGGSATVTAGSFLARRNGAPALFDVAPGSRATVLILPTSVLGGSLGARRLLGSSGSAAMRVLTAHARMVRETAHELGRPGVLAARDALVELARGALRQEFDDTEPRLSPALARAAMLLADEHLTDPGLTPSSLARRLNVSLRTLHRAFAGTGEPVAAYIRRRRLECARQELLAPGNAPSVTEAAARWHFTDGSHFTRAFKRQYGETPTQVRARIAPSPRSR